MAARGAAQILRAVEGRERIDDEPNTMMDESSRSMAEHIIQSVGDRFERRLTEEISGLDHRLSEEISGLDRRLSEEISGLDRRLTEEISRIDRRLAEEIAAVRVEMHQGFGALRSEMHKGFGELRFEIATGQAKANRWAALLWIGQIGAVGGLLAYLK